MDARDLADALDCFWNAAIGEAHTRQSSSAMDAACVMATGISAIANRLREQAESGPKETIVAAALKLPSMFYDGDLIISAPPPARHYTLLHPMHSHMSGGKYRFTPDDQGFLTNKGRYVGREEALQIALASGQPMIDHPSRHATQLFSEDLW